jgi:hypothetical protein
MRKTVFVLLGTLLFSVIAYTIQAAVSREVTEINMPEGIIVEIEEEDVAAPPRNYISPDAETLVEVETVEISEGMITIITESIAPDFSGTQTNENPSEHVSEQLQPLQDTLIRLQKEVEAFK